MTKKQFILACDEKGRFSGEYIPKEIGHTGKGRRHLAIVVLLYSSKGAVLLQKRKHHVFDGIWDLTGATHPLQKNSGYESLKEATLRCLKTEYSITEPVEVDIVGAFNYFAQDESKCENEHCSILIGEYNGRFTPNPDVAYECRWVNKRDFLEDIEKTPEKYSAWAIEGVKVLKESGFFNLPLR